MASGGLPFLGFPSWDPTGAILLNNPSLGQPQGTSVYDLIGRGYMPGDPNAFFGALPNLTTPAGIGTPTLPQAGYYPAQDYSGALSAINAMGRQQANVQMGDFIQGGIRGGERLLKNYYNGPGAGGTGATAGGDNVPIDAFGAGVDIGAEAPGAFSSALSSIGNLAGQVGPYMPYIGALLQAGMGFASGSQEGLQRGFVGAAGTVANSFLPGAGFLLTAPADDYIGPSKAWKSFPERTARYATDTANAAQGLSNQLANTNDFHSIYNSLLDFRGDIGKNIPYGGQDTMFTPWALHPDEIMKLDPSFKQYQGYDPNTNESVYGLRTNNLSDLRQGNDALVAYLRELERGDLAPESELFKDVGKGAENAIPFLPGATGTAHEGNISFDLGGVTQGLRDQLSGTVEGIYGNRYHDPAKSFADSLANARSSGDIDTALKSLYAGIGGGYGANAPSSSAFGQGPSAEQLGSAIPDFPGLSNQDVPVALRQELGSAYSGVINKSNPFTGRQGLPAPSGALGVSLPGANEKTTRLATGGRTDALGNAIYDANTFLGG